MLWTQDVTFFSVTFYPHLRLIGGGSTWHPCHVFCIVCASEKGTGQIKLEGNELDLDEAISLISRQLWYECGTAVNTAAGKTRKELSADDSGTDSTMHVCTMATNASE